MLKISGKIGAITFAGALSLGVLNSLPATAATLTSNFSFTPTSGTLEQVVEIGETITTPLNPPFPNYSGFFSYDDSLLTRQGIENINIERQNLNVNFPNINLPLASYDGQAIFQNGNLTNLNINWEPCKEENLCYWGGSFFGSIGNSNSTLFLNDNQLGGPYYFTTYTGLFTASQQTEKVPEPALIWGFFTLGIGLLSKKPLTAKK